MSTRRVGTAKGRRRKGARTTAPGGRSDLGVFDGLCREILGTQGRDVLRGGDPLEAEMWASYLVGLWRSGSLIGESDPAAAIGGRMLTVAKRMRTPEAVICLNALGAVADGELRERARAAADQMASAGIQAPQWVAGIGTAQATQAWRATDVCGDQDALMIGFAYPGGGDHCMMVLVDHVLGGIAKDAAVLGPPAEVIPLWQATSDVDVVEEPVSVIAGRAMAAVEWTDHTIDAPVTDDFVETAALLSSRLGPIAAPSAEREPLAPDTREQLVKTFLADSAGALYARDPGAWYLIDAAVDYRCDHHHADPLRWSPTATKLFLLDFAPRKMSTDRDNLARIPEVLRAWVRWASPRAGLPDQLTAATLAAIDEVENEFGAALDDEHRWGPAKRIAMRMMAAGVDPSDLDRANAWLATQRSA
jgi:hypothetical protein